MTHSTTLATGVQTDGSAIVKLYFNEFGARARCVGGSANSWWFPDYAGDYIGSASFRLPKGYDPHGKEYALIRNEAQYIGG